MVNLLSDRTCQDSRRASCLWIYIVLIAIALSCKSEPTDSAPPSDHSQQATSVDQGTAAMVAELKAIASDRSNIDLWHLNRPRAQALDAKASTERDPGQKISLIFQSGIEWLNAGDYQTAISRLQSILDFAKANNLKLPAEAKYAITEVLGIAHLRKAEIENCLNNHNEYSCLFPIVKDGKHEIRDGAQSAQEIFKSLLSSPQSSAQTQWLYNITHMALGTYPQGVEKDHLLSPDLFSSDVDFPRFTDVAMGTGVAVNDISGSVVMEDFDKDGYLDLMVSSYGLDDQLRLYMNDQDGSFRDATASAGLTGLYSGLNMVQADYDNDGYIDVLVLRGAWLGKDGQHPNSLLRNNGDGTFSDVTRVAGLYSKFPTQTASWADINLDGWIDLFIGNEHSASAPATCELYINDGTGKFTEQAATYGLDMQVFTKGCVWGDYDNDGDPDLYISCINSRNYLWQNGGSENNFTFKEVAQTAKVSEPLRSFPCWFFDYNQDGWEDLFVSGFDFSQFQTAAREVALGYMGQATQAELPRLYQNNKDGTFSEVSAAAGVDEVLFTMGCNFGDLNGDGYPDFYAATGTPDFRALIPNRMFLNDRGKKFLDVTTAGAFGHLQKGHGVAFGDIDNDGDQDIYSVLGGSYDGDNFMNALFANPGFDQDWMRLSLVGVECNRAAIGARLEVTLIDPATGASTTRHARVQSGGSFGANSLRVELGIDPQMEIDELKIFWPGQTDPQVIAHLEKGKHYQITQNLSEIKDVTAKAVKLNAGHGGHHH